MEAPNTIIAWPAHEPVPKLISSKLIDKTIELTLNQKDCNIIVPRYERIQPDQKFLLQGKKRQKGKKLNSPSFKAGFTKFKPLVSAAPQGGS